MLKAPTNPTLILYAAGQPKATFSLDGMLTTIGRDPANTVMLDDASVSRRHAEIDLRDGAAVLHDLGSRNGILVNGVPRKSASLHPGDRLRIGQIDLQFATGFIRPLAPPARTAKTETATPLDLTRKHRSALPDKKQDRHLAALYHLFFRATEGVDAEEFLELLLDGVRAQLAQFYTPAGELAFTATAEKVKATPKFAAYLLEKFQLLTEATPYAGAELGRFQPKLGGWHYLVAPLRSPAAGNAGPVPLVALLRAAEWEEFSIEDRTLLTAAARLWPAAPAPGPAAVSAPAIKAIAVKPPASKPVVGALGLLGESAVLKQLRTRLDRVAPTNVTVLITGESGSGKEVIAQYLHASSPRAKVPLVTLNCSAITPSLAESELFGHVKGAFTGAVADKPGCFQLANKGTLFLDEIGELPLDAQAKLLRVLENGEVQKVGGGLNLKVDVRILAATNRDLRLRVKEGAFREDLLYRLEVATIAVPPLREHLEDLPVIAQHFLEKYCADNGVSDLSFAPEALTALQQHDWPGNVRMLRNVVQRLALNADAAVITSAEVKQQIG